MATPAPTHSIGDEIPYRRSAGEKRTGSLVFDQHRDEKLAQAPRDHDVGERPGLTD